MSPTARPMGAYVSRRRRFLLPVLALSSVALAAPEPVRADGFRILDQGAAATAQGAAFAAQADDPSAIHYNPAGMSQLPGLQLYLGANLVSGDTSFTSISGASTSGGTEGTVSNPPPSQAYITWSLGGLQIPLLREVTLGLGLAAPFGLQVTYPKSGPLANVTTHAALPLLDIKPTIAYRLGPYLSLGAGLDIYTFSSLIGDGQAEQKRIAGPEFALLGIAPGSTVEVNGVDTAVGFNVSALATLIRTDDKPRLNVGLVYRSRATLDLSGHFEVNGVRTSRAEIEFNLPWILTGAVAAWPVRTGQHEWKLELDVDYVDWTSFRNLDVKLDSGVTLPSAQKWSDTVVVMFGTEFKWLRPSGLQGWEIAARGGYIRSMTPVPRQTFGPTIADADYNAFSAGLGLHCRAPGRLFGLVPCGGESRPAWVPRVGVDLSYQAVLYDERRISNNNDPRVNGVWDTTTHVGSISFRLGF